MHLHQRFVMRWKIKVQHIYTGEKDRVSCLLCSIFNSMFKFTPEYQAKLMKFYSRKSIRIVLQLKDRHEYNLPFLSFAVFISVCSQRESYAGNSFSCSSYHNFGTIIKTFMTNHRIISLFESFVNVLKNINDINAKQVHTAMNHINFNPIAFTWSSW
jgi:hypothetical protein